MALKFKMTSIEEYIRELAKWRGEAISSIRELNKNDDQLSECINNVKAKVSDLENRIIVIETKSRMISIILVPIVISIVTMLFDMFIRHLW